MTDTYIFKFRLGNAFQGDKKCLEWTFWTCLLSFSLLLLLNRDQLSSITSQGCRTGGGKKNSQMKPDYTLFFLNTCQMFVSRRHVWAFLHSNSCNSTLPSQTYVIYSDSGPYAPLFYAAKKAEWPKGLKKCQEGLPGSGRWMPC